MSQRPANGTRHSAIPICIYTPILEFLPQRIWEICTCHEVGWTDWRTDRLMDGQCDYYFLCGHKNQFLWRLHTSRKHCLEYDYPLCKNLIIYKVGNEMEVFISSYLDINLIQTIVGKSVYIFFSFLFFIESPDYRINPRNPDCFAWRWKFPIYGSVK